MEASRTALGNTREQLFAQLCQRTRDMEKIAASLSHELKNPLQAIKILVQLSAREVREPEARERLQVAEAEVERMQALIKDYLSFSRPLDKLQPHPVDLGSLSDEVIAVLRERAASSGISLVRRGDARVEADARRLREALHNLVSNAVDASPRGGSIRIEISEAEGAARIAVRDSGRGMSPETLERVGTPFFTTRDEGTGLGVALARAAFAQHGGSLEYESKPGSGTTATAILPTKRASDDARPGR
jgi:signal transduction histidine kinase